MSKFSPIRYFRNISIAKKLYFTVGIMALLIAVELVTLWFAISTLSSVRAYVGGEGLWSKAQKDAIYHLEKYGYTRNESDYLAFQNFMKVPAGDHIARLELQKLNPDMDVARAGFLSAKNNSKDVDGMINLFRRFHSISYIGKAIEIWTKADSISVELYPIGDSLHKEINSSSPSQEKINALLLKISPVNEKLTPIEDDFSFTLGEGSRWLEGLILKILFSIALTVEISGLLLTISVSRGIQKGLDEIIRQSKIIATGDFSKRAKKYSQDEIGVLADSFNRMTSDLEQQIINRKESEEKLIDSEEALRQLIEAAPDGVIIVDEEGRITKWNLQAETMFGWKENEVIGKTLTETIIPERYRKRHEEGMKLFLKTGAENVLNRPVEITALKKNNVEFPVELKISASLLKSGYNFIGFIRDITNRKIAENALIQSRAGLSMAQQLSHIGSWEWDLITNKLTWSDELYRIYGLIPGVSDIAYDKLTRMKHEGEGDSVTKIIAESRKTHKPFDFYHRIVRDDRSVRTLHAMGEVIVNDAGEAIKMIGTEQDITDRLREEDMEKLALAATKSNNSVIIADQNGMIEWVNEGFTKLTGYILDDVKNTHGEILRRGEATGLKNDTELFHTMINEKKSVVYEGKNFSKDGNEYWVITTLTPMLNKDGKVEKIIAIDSNITERKQIEEDLLLANKIAEHSLKKGNKALNELMKAKRELEESMKVKEQFLAKMSHEIRTPMNAIVGLTDILLEGNISLEQKECLEAVKLSSDNLLSIINDILDFSKLESGKLFLETLPFSLKEVIDGVFVTLRLTASHKGLDLSYSIQEDVPEIIVGDALRLRQILLNLLSNSVKFTEHGSVRVDVELTGKTTENSTLRFKISDTGIGIPEDRLATIFESFTQASNETSRKYGGTGLGLTIVKQLTELQGGTVEVKSVLNKGTEFFVTLSFKNKTEEDNASKLSQKENEREMIGAIKVLLAEDNEMNQMVAQKVLVKWGFTVEIAENGKHTIQKLTDSNYDLILMDIQMPEMDGYEATKFIRNNMPAPKSGIPIIAMTAHAIVGEAEKCIALGMDDYISKPFNQKDLYEKIAKQIKKAGTMENKERHKENGKAKEEDFSCIDLSYLEEIAEGNSEFVRKMISAFLNQAPGMLNDMKKFTAEKRWKELRGVSHKIKPSLDFVGIHSLKETVGNLEKYSAEESNLELIPGMVKEVNLICTQAIAELEKKIAQYS